MIVVAVNESMSQILGKSELEEDGLLVGEEFDEADLAGVGLLKEEELVARDVPVGRRGQQRLLEHHLARLRPHLQKEWFAPADFDYLRLVDFDQDRAELGALLELAAGHNFIQLFKRHMVGYLVHIILGRVILSRSKVVQLMRLLNLAEHFFWVVHRLIKGVTFLY